MIQFNSSLPPQSSVSGHVMVIAGEPSGDLHAGNVVKYMKKYKSGLIFSGIGGYFLKKEGVDLFYDIENLSVMGITEVLLQFRQIRAAFKLFKEKLKSTRPDLLILVDYPGFNLKAAEIAKKYNINVLYFISPKIWAWNRKRILKIKKFVDHTALILPFEEKIYRKAGARATYVGNPLLSQYPETISKPFLRKIRQLKNEGKPSVPYRNNRKIVIGLLPGSRRTEVINLFKIMVDSADIIARLFLKNTGQKILFLVSKAQSIKRSALDSVIETSENKKQFKIHEGEVRDVFIHSDVLIAASGTVTLEAALCCVPTVIIYKMSGLTHFIARRLVKIKYAGLANLILNREVMPELLQDQATPENISEKIMELFEKLEYFENQLQLVRKNLGKENASAKTAQIALDLMSFESADR